MNRLEGRAALVTGSSRGIGAAIARRLASDGARLILHASSDATNANAVAEAIRKAGGEAQVILGDLTTADAPARIVSEAHSCYGQLDILVLNAGGNGRTSRVVDYDVETVDQVISLNLRATILATAEFGRLTQSSHGRVIFISSGVAVHPAFGASGLAAAKAGAEAFIRSAAQEFGARGITLNTVSPGTTVTDLTRGQAWTEKVIPWTALQRLGEPEDIADIVAFVASDDARWLTGATLPANGGLITTAANILAKA